MKKTRALVAFGILSLFILLIFPLQIKAEETFSTTVKIVGYDYQLNGQLVPLAQGSGTLISASGQVLTNAHVIIDPRLNKPLKVFSICVSETPQEIPDCRFTGTLERFDEKIDLALLNLNTSPVWGTLPSPFPYLAYDHGIEPTDGEAVTVKGFSVSGGVTINTTKGQISGFEQYNGFNYLKTDADIDSGNSGGTMLDAEGNLIGVPTYVVANLETSGRALNITEVKKWIDAGTGQKGMENKIATEKLSKNLKRLYEANEARKIENNAYPNLSAGLPEGWEFTQVNEQQFSIKKIDNEMGLLEANVMYTPFKLKSGTKEIAIEGLKKMIGETFPHDETITISGKDAFHFWNDIDEGTLNITLIPHGYAYIILVYIIPTSDITETKAGINSFLTNLSFAETEEDYPNPKQLLSVPEYPFTLQVSPDWRIIKNEFTGNSLAMAGIESPYLEEMGVYYRELPKAQVYMSPASLLKGDLEDADGDIIFQSSELTVDGLPGYLYISETESGGKVIKKAVAGIMDPEYTFQLTYDSDKAVFEEGFKDFVYTLKSFKSKRYDSALKTEWSYLIKAENKGKYIIPQPTATIQVNLSDIAGHRYEQNIKNLVAMGVINGNPDGTFDPEGLVNRAAALKIILQSLRAQQLANGEAPFVMPPDFNKFNDVTPDLWYATYVAEGVQKGIISGYPDGTFKGANNVILAEALKMAFEAHDANLWSGITEPWYKKYFDAAYQLSLLPADLQDPGHPLTRAELAYIVDQLVSQ